MTTAIVILNWNGRHFLEKYLPCLLESMEGLDGVRAVVADSASTDLSLEMLAERFPQVQTIALDKNYGFAGGYNKALACLQDDCFILLNSDVEPDADWIYPLVEWMQLHPECGICGPKLHMISERERFEYAGAAGGMIDHLGYPFCRGRVMDRTEIDQGQYDLPAEVFWVSGAALMIRSSLFFSLGGFCDEFFAHMEEIDLCWRARLQGWTVCTVPRSVVYHVGGGSLPKESPQKLLLNYRNNLLMLSRNLPYTYALLMAFYIPHKIVSPDDGPDMFRNTLDYYSEIDSSFRKDWVRAAASTAIILTDSLLRRRMILDGLSCLAYLLKGKISYIKAVWTAHRQFKAMRKKVDEKKLAHYLKDVLGGKELTRAKVILTEDPLPENFSLGSFGVKGMWDKWIVWQSITRKDAIFAKIKDNLL